MSRALSDKQLEKAASGWFKGVNSTVNQWLMDDRQIRWGVNVVCRGGIVQTRPGYHLTLTLPNGNLQGYKLFKVTKTDSPNFGLVFAVAVVDGIVYAVPQPFNQPTNWNAFRLPGIQFDPQAKRIYWCATEKNVQTSSTGIISLSSSGSYSILMMQDGVSAAAFWDGDISRHLDENAAETPRGTWMAAAGNRLWVARGVFVLAGDIFDPLSFRERTEAESRGDFKFTAEISGLSPSIGENRRSNLLVFTQTDTSSLLASIEDRSKWVETDNFQSTVYPYDGCIAGKSITPHSGLLYWYSQKGLVYADAATTSFLTSQIKVRDVEMAYSKRNFAPDLSGICGIDFEGYLLMSVPSGDTLNAHTMVLDTHPADELGSELPPAWNGVWTGTRPVEWSSEIIDGQRRIFHASSDYAPLGTPPSVNHIWEAFQASRTDSYDQLDADNSLVRVDNNIYCEFETKLLGDGLDLKQFSYAEFRLREVGGESIVFKASYAGMKGEYHEILKKIISANLVPPSGNSQAQTLYAALGNYFSPQSRHLVSQTAKTALDNCPNIEAPYTDDIDMAFSLRMQWCGRLGVDSLRIIMSNYPERSFGKCENDETDINILSNDGQTFKIKPS